jgi:hypothetical protein
MQTFVPYWDEHVADKPVWVTSLAQRKGLMKAGGWDYRGLKPGMPPRHEKWGKRRTRLL